AGGEQNESTLCRTHYRCAGNRRGPASPVHGGSKSHIAGIGSKGHGAEPLRAEVARVPRSQRAGALREGDRRAASEGRSPTRCQVKLASVKRILAVTSLLALALRAEVATAAEHRLTLDEAVRMALQRNEGLLIERESLAA